MSAALREAEAAAENFPEVAGPLVNALKLAAMRQAAAPKVVGPSAEEISALTTERARQAAAEAVQRSAIDALAEEHPDYETVRETAAFKAWIESKPADFRTRLENTWNPAIVSKGLTEFKESQRTKQRKQDRLSNAVVPNGAPAPAAPSTPTAERADPARLQAGRPAAHA